LTPPHNNDPKIDSRLLDVDPLKLQLSGHLTSIAPILVNFKKSLENLEEATTKAATLTEVQAVSDKVARTETDISDLRKDFLDRYKELRTSINDCVKDLLASITDQKKSSERKLERTESASQLKLDKVEQTLTDKIKSTEHSLNDRTKSLEKRVDDFNIPKLKEQTNHQEVDLAKLRVQAMIYGSLAGGFISLVGSLLIWLVKNQ